jgi:hypothetical protein
MTVWQPDKVFVHDDFGVCLYNAITDTWYRNDDGQRLLSPRPPCERSHEA